MIRYAASDSKPDGTVDAQDDDEGTESEDHAPERRAEFAHLFCVYSPWTAA